MARQELFIGREDELKQLRQDIFVTEPGPGHCYSLIGPNEVGKTTLVRKAAAEFREKEHPHVYYFPTSLMACTGYWDFWVSLIQAFSRRITEEELYDAPDADLEYIQDLLRIYQFFNDDKQLDQMGQRSFHIKATGYLNSLFEDYTDLGIHIILTIDEFDNAAKVFPSDSGDGSFFQRLFTFTPKGASILNLSILLISRRRVGTIAHHMSDGSDFEAGFPPITLRGFTDENMEAYFDSYSQLPCGKLDDRRRRDVIYFCGRHPGLLTKMRHTIAEHCQPGVQPNVGMLYRDYGLAMTTIYERMCKLMRMEYVNQERTKNCIGPFAQAFVGPAYDPHLPDWIEQMYQYGFLTKGYPGKKNIFHMAGLLDGSENANGQGFQYEPLSPYFVEYFKNRILPDELDGLIKLLNQTELTIRKVILDRLKTLPDWETKLENYIPAKKIYFRDNLESFAAANDASLRNLTFTGLDVMSFSDYAFIICDQWTLMSSYFGSFTTRTDLRDEFRFLKDARDCSAHNNAEVLNERSCARLRELCTRLMKDMEAGEQLERDRLRAQKAAAWAALPYPPLAEQTDLPGKTVTFRCQELSENGGLRGVLSDGGFGAGFSKKKLENRGAASDAYVGTDFSAVVISWDANERLFWLDFPGESGN